MFEYRGSGVLLHLSSLPGGFGIGDLGAGARAFIDFLAAAGQRYWQFLPIGPCSPVFDSSPYMSLSAFAGNPILIDLVQLVDEGLLGNKDFNGQPEFSEYTVDFEKVIPFKTTLLRRAYEKFKSRDGETAFVEFCKEEAAWLDDYALFMALREEHQQQAWFRWPDKLAAREDKAMTASRRRLGDAIGYHQFVQYCFYKQWNAMREYAASQGILLVGDIPIYVSFDSADVWAHRDCFRLDPRTFEPTHVAGVPPDYFSATGQRWGNPLYQWQIGKGKVNRKLYDWWRARFQNIFKTVDIVRIDHFRGFEAFWEIPADEETAINGRWVKGPGKSFFDAMATAIGDLPIIAEDLGVITPEVEKLRDQLGFPGMKVLQFAFDSDADNLYLPHNYRDPNCVVYTGTHDNDTTLGWIFSPDVAQESKDRAARYANSSGDVAHWDFLRMALGSVAQTAIIPLQDVLGFGTDCRMNKPSTCEGNWRWRCADRFLTDTVAAKLRDETCFYGRC